MILVTGGTGLVGSHLLYFLLKKEASVRAIHRKTSNLESVKEVFSYYTEDAESLFRRIDWVEANVTDVPALTTAFEGITQVYHSAAYISFNPKHFGKLQKSNTEGTANVVNLCLVNHITKLCHVSSIAALGSTDDDTLISEETHWNPYEDNNVYAITKYGAEMEVWRGTQEGLNAVIVNPGVILGSGHWNSGSGTIIKRAAAGGKYYTGGGVAVVDVKDVVKAMISLMESSVKNEQFILVGSNLYNKELLSRLAVNFGVAKPSKEIAKWKLMFLSKLDWISSTFFKTKRKLLKVMVISLYKVSFYDGSKIEKAISFSYTPIEETIRGLASDFKNRKA